MTDKELRELQKRFLSALEEFGMFHRVKDGMAIPLFDKHSPTAVQLSMRTYPEYASHMKEYLRLYERSKQGRPSKTRNRSHDSSKGDKGND